VYINDKISSINDLCSLSWTFEAAHSIVGIIGEGGIPENGITCRLRRFSFFRL
jgi:hypothetical protein